MFRKIISNLFLGFLLVLLLDISIGKTLRYFYFRESSGQHYRTTIAFDSTTADLLIIGSSKACHNYVPQIFESSLKMSYYNAGRDGSSILYSYAVFKAILSRYKPKIIIIDINPEEYYLNPSSYDRLSSLLPYFITHPEIRDIVSLRGPFERVKLLSSIYPFNSLLTTIIIGNLSLNEMRKPDINGFVPLYGKLLNMEKVQLQKPIGQLDLNKINAFDSIAKICFEKNIFLFVCNSPTYNENMETEADSIIRIKVEKYGFNYFNYSNDSRIVTNPDFFRDNTHLNIAGAEYFSSLFLDSIQ